MRRRSTMLALALACATAFGACGGSDEQSKAEYGESMRATMSNLTEAYGDASTASGEAGDDVAATVRQLRASQLALRDAGNQLDDIEPPEELAAAHEDLVEGVREMADAVDLLIEAQELAETDPKAAEQAARKFGSDDSFERVTAAAARLEKAGVDTGL